MARTFNTNISIVLSSQVYTIGVLYFWWYKLRQSYECVQLGYVYIEFEESG